MLQTHHRVLNAFTHTTECLMLQTQTNASDTPECLMLQTQHRVLNASDTECLMLQTQHRVLNASDTTQSA